MPFSWNGCGTKYYGERELEADVSYITTEWIVFVCLPLVPIGSFRVIPGKSSGLIFYKSRQYYVTSVPLNGLQIRNTYLASVAIFMGIQMGFTLLAYMASPPTPVPTIKSIQNK